MMMHGFGRWSLEDRCRCRVLYLTHFQVAKLSSIPLLVVPREQTLVGYDGYDVLVVAHGRRVVWFATRRRLAEFRSTASSR